MCEGPKGERTWNVLETRRCVLRVNIAKQREQYKRARRGMAALWWGLPCAG